MIISSQAAKDFGWDPLHLQNSENNVINEGNS